MPDLNKLLAEMENRGQQSRQTIIQLEQSNVVPKLAYQQLIIL